MAEEAEAWAQERMGEARTIVFEVVERHERESHGGEMCEGGRANLIAWFAHSIGIRVGDLPMVADALSGYEEHHEHRQEHRHEGPS